MEHKLYRGAYQYKITPSALVRSFMGAYALRLSGLREVAARCAPWLRTGNYSSLSHALRRSDALRFVQTLVEWLAMHRPAVARDSLVAIDGMAVTLPATQRHNCKKYNRRTVGGGVIWSFAIDARRGECPVRVLKVIEGAWRDAARMKDVALAADGPVYLMDRGFYALALVQRWITRGVRFIVRVRCDAKFELLRELSPPRRYGTGRIELDAWVRLGSPGAQAHPEARLVRAVVGKQTLVLVTGERSWSAERVLDAYKKRERIEKFHQVLKDVLGLAHLYSFAQSGMMFLLHTALLLAILLILEHPRGAAGEDTVAILRCAYKALRQSLGLGNPWKRNTYVNQRKSHVNH